MAKPPSARKSDHSRLIFPMEREPGSVELSAELRDSRDGHLEAAGNIGGAVPSGQRLGDFPVSPWKCLQPFREINPEPNLVRHGRAMVLDNCLLPAFRRIKPIEPLQPELFPTLTVVRGDIQDVEPSSDLPSGTNLENGIPGEHCRESHAFFARLHKSGIRHAGVGHRFLDGFGLGLGPRARGMLARRN